MLMVDSSKDQCLSYCGHTKDVGGSGKRQLADGSFVRVYASGKLRGLRLPLPPELTELA
jgi:hypothetical protein